jgi:hypothetical protein
MLPKMAESGIDKQPDLVILASLFWDEGFIRDVSRARVVVFRGFFGLSKPSVTHLLSPPTLVRFQGHPLMLAVL